MFGICPNIMSLQQLLLFFSSDPNFIVLFLPKFPSNRLQTSAQYNDPYVFNLTELNLDFNVSKER